MLDFSGLPQIDPGAAGCINALMRRREPFALSIPIGDQSVPFTFDHHARLQPRKDLLTIRIETPIGEIGLTIEIGLLDTLSDGLLPRWRDVTKNNLPIMWRVITCIDAIFANSTATDQPWSVLSVSRIEDDSFGLDVAFGTARLGTSDWGCAIAFSGAEPDALTSRIEQPLEKAPLATYLDFEVTISVAAAELYLNEVTTLCPGDLIILPNVQSTSIPAVVNISGYCGWKGTIMETGEFIAKERTEKREIMTNTLEAPNLLEIDVIADDVIQDSEAEADTVQVAENLNDETLADLPIKLEICLKPQFLPLSGFSDLSAGASMDLNLDLTDTVRILANGKVFGLGRLVQIGDRVGVQIEHWRNVPDNTDG